MQSICDRCGAEVDQLGVCASCGRHTPLSAPERIALLTDSFDEQDAALVGGDPLKFPEYPNTVYAARFETGLAEAAVWGWADLEEQRCALLVLDFRFLGGSMGVAVGEKVARAFDAASRARCPVVTVTASGGARMQEGMAALVQMAKTVEARRRHRRAQQPHVTLLTSPTTGGVYASFASLADVILAEPEAHVGFAGPRVVAELTGERPARHVHTAEFAVEHGLADGIVPRRAHRETMARLLRWLTGTTAPPRLHGGHLALAREPDDSRSAWQRLQMARDQARPTATDILDIILMDPVELHGDRAGSDDPAVVVRVGALAHSGRPVIAVGQSSSGTGRISSAGFRKAQRAIEVAGRLGLPVVTLVDTRGAEPGEEAEATGVAAAIARTLEVMLDCPSPTLAVVTGEGGSGGALATAPADRLIAWENAVFSVIAPEGAASILYRDTSRAEELAGQLRITARDLVELGIVDVIVPEPAGGAQADPESAIHALGAEVAREIDGLCELPSASRLGNRRRRWRRVSREWLRLV